MSFAAASTLVLALVGLAILMGLAGFCLVSVREREPRAARRAAVLVVAGSLPLFVAAGLPVAVRLGVLAVVASAGLAAVALWLLPIGSSLPGNGRTGRRVDERDIMFARARLRPGSPEHDTYYAMRPENKEGDDRTRALPGLLSLDAAKADPVVFATAEASFAVVVPGSSGRPRTYLAASST